MSLIIRKRKKPTVQNEISNKNKPHWDKIKGGENFCYVCDKKFKPKHTKIYIGQHNLTGEKLFRHSYCESGSDNWNKKFGGRIIMKDSKSKKEYKNEKKKKEKTTTITIIKRRKK
jgi:hypothetical protein